MARTTRKSAGPASPRGAQGQATKQGSRGPKARQTQPPPAAVSRRKALEMLDAERPEPLGDNIPADAPPPGPGPTDIIRIGQRAFRARPGTLAGRRLDILPDLPDIRDRIYQPHLRSLAPGRYPLIAFPVRDQGQGNSCTGFALAHVIDCLMHRADLAEAAPRVSARMLYEMARLNDSWAGTAYEGSSIRGAISGFFRNGVCTEALAPSAARTPWKLTYAMAREARQSRLGAYYRLQPDLSDYHAALNEIGVIYASAQIHAHWEKPDPRTHRITPGGPGAGGHAFAIVGYDAEGFWVLNSWGEAWGRQGTAHWSYQDWASTIMDAWVLQLGVRAPGAFSAVPRATPAGAATPRILTAPNRSDIVGHFINIDDGRYITSGRYASPSAAEMTETVGRLTDANSNDGRGYQHLVLYAHGGLNTLDDEAARIAGWKQRAVFSRNGIYNFHLMWGSGFLDEAFGPLSDTQAGRAAGILGDLLFETGPGKAIGSAAWRNMKQDAVAAFTEAPGYDGGIRGLQPLLEGLGGSRAPPLLHLVGHSAGAIMLGRLLGALHRLDLGQLELGGVHLMAPACTADFFNELYGPLLSGGSALRLNDKVYLYNMRDSLELADRVGVASLPGYGRSLLYLVSRAFEEQSGTPLAGMEIHAARLKPSAKLSFTYAVSPETASTSHGGFDNDAATLTTIMSRILGRPAPHPPTADELLGY